MQLSPYHAGLAGRHLQRLPVAPAFPTCSFPLRLSPSGQSDDPGATLRAPPDCVRDSTPRSAAHLSGHTAFPLSVILSLDRVMLEAQRPQVLRLVGIRLPAEDTPRTDMVHMPRSKCDSRAASRPLARVVVTGHDLATSILRTFPAL